LEFDLSTLPINYKVVANIPYYLTGSLLRMLTDSANPPARTVLLVQKEVAQRIAAEPGQMSILSVGAQLDYEPKLGAVVPAGLFTPPPKVNSQVVVLARRSTALFKPLDKKVYMRIVKAGFSERRKKIRSSLSGGLGITKPEVDKLLAESDISGDRRAQELSLQDWYKIYKAYEKNL